MKKEELIKKLRIARTNYTRISNKYRVLKADLILVKKQIENIANNIYVNCLTDKLNSSVGYHKGGYSRRKNNKKWGAEDGMFNNLFWGGS